jgi:hypothetical protein
MKCGKTVWPKIVLNDLEVCGRGPLVQYCDSYKIVSAITPISSLIGYKSSAILLSM